MKIPIVPDHWKLSVDEQSAGCYEILAVATDSRLIEWKGYDAGVEQAIDDTVKSIRKSDLEVAERLTLND